MTKLAISLALAAALSATACSKSKKPTTIATATSDGSGKPTGTSQPTTGTATVTPVGPGSEQAPAFGAIYFEFDSTTLSASARASLEAIGDYLTDHPVTLVIEGHADDRGTTEYNIALGQRRAEVIKEFLLRMGAPAANLDTISYGEERPAVDGEDESAWAQNRRGEVHPR